MKTYKNPISTAMSEYREDFRYNREWWVERMGNGNNNEYLWIQFKNGDNITVQADYFQIDGNTCLPRFRADEVAYISRYFGDQCETTTAADIVVDTDRIILYADGVEYFRYEMSEEEFKEMRCQMWELDDETDSTAWMLDYCRALATSKMNNNGNTDNTMKVNNTLNVSDLTNWINFQLSTIIEGVSAGYTLGNNNTVWIDRGATVFTVSLATGEEIEIDSDNYATAEDIAKAIISILNNNTPSTSDTMNTETKAMNEARRNELQAMADNAREWDIKTRGKAMKSDYAYMVLELMDTEEHANNYCSALREVLAAFPEVDRDELEIELDRFI